MTYLQWVCRGMCAGATLAIGFAFVSSPDEWTTVNPVGVVCFGVLCMMVAAVAVVDYVKGGPRPPPSR